VSIIENEHIKNQTRIFGSISSNRPYCSKCFKELKDSSKYVKSVTRGEVLRCNAEVRGKIRASEEAKHCHLKKDPGSNLSSIRPLNE
jgi:hypothetical protein